MNAKTKKIWNVVANVVVIVILVFVAIITLNIILSRDKGYTPFFGNTFVAVQSDSMNGAKPEGEDFADENSRKTAIFLQVKTGWRQPVN